MKHIIKLILIFACCIIFLQQAFSSSIFFAGGIPTDTISIRLPEKRPWFKSICISKVGITITQIPADLFNAHLQANGEQINWDAVEQKFQKEMRSSFFSGTKGTIPYFSEEINNETNQVDRLLSPFADSLNAQLGTYSCSKEDNADSLLLVDGLITRVRLFHVKTSRKKTRYKAKIYASWIVKEDEDARADTINTYGYSMLLPTAEEALSNGVFSCFTQLFSNQHFMRLLLVDTTTKVTDTFNIEIPKAKRIVTTLDEALQAIVSIKRNDGRIGTGFAITHDGYLLTASHLVFNQRKHRTYPFTVVLPSGQELPAEVIRVDTAQNVALVHCNTTVNYAYALPEAKNHNRLEEVYVIGTPGTLELEQSVSLGIISGERNLNGKDILQLNININTGNEGGPVMSKSGKLNGLIISKLIAPKAEGVSFAIPAYRIVQYLHITIHP